MINTLAILSGNLIKGVSFVVQSTKKREFEGLNSVEEWDNVIPHNFF
jgi:hypothetical protein